MVAIVPMVAVTSGVNGRDLYGDDHTVGNAGLVGVVAKIKWPGCQGSGVSYIVGIIGMACLHTLVICHRLILHI
jgi:hypothetical protein